jgi:TolB-like protein/Tfp pilus assembly protein PilF
VSILKQLLSELNRRHVFKMTAIYIVAGWVVVQVASEAFPALNIPEGAIAYVWLAVLIGFPVALAFSWRYDLTVSGIRRTPAANEDAATVAPLTRLDYSILSAFGLVMLVLAIGVVQRLLEVQTEAVRAPTSRAIDPNSIAVLPLDNLSPSADDAYFAAGVHDALITSLSRVSALMVTSRTSAQRVNPELSVPEIGRQLGVAKLLEGSVLVDGGRVRVIVQLIDAATDLHLWAETYERDLADIIGLQNEIARTISEVIAVRLTTREATLLARSESVDPATYRAYLKGMYQLYLDTPEGNLRGVEMLEEVVRQDPDSALAHAGLAIGYANIGHDPPFPAWSYLKAKASAERALELDPELAEAHTAEGAYRLLYEWDFDGAERALKRAIELNPSLALAHYDLGWLYELMGPEWEEEALAAGERARTLSPLKPFFVGGLAWQLVDACRYEEAMRLAREAIRLNPEHSAGWAALGLTHMEMGEFDEAIAAYKKLDGTAWSWMIGMAYASVGLEDKAREMTAALEQVADQPGIAMVLSWIYMNLGEVETALHWLAETEKARTPWYPWLLGMFHGSELMADDPRYQVRAAALGLPDPRTMGCRG